MAEVVARLEKHVKSKASMLKKEMNKTGGGISSIIKPLTHLEEKRLSFIGPCVVSGHEEIPDPLTSARQDSWHGVITETAREEEGPVEVTEFAVYSSDSNQDISMLRFERSSTITSPAQVSPVSTPLISPFLASTEDNVPSASGGLPAGQESLLYSSSSVKKRKRSVGRTSPQEDDPLLALTREQIECMHEQNELRRKINSIAQAQLQVEERTAVAIERAAEALEEYLRHRRGNE